jgi:serine protease Do
MNKFRSFSAVIFLGVSALACAPASAEQPKQEPQPPAHAALGVTSFAPIVERVTPSVVSVYTTKTIKSRMERIPPEWRRFFGDALPGGKLPPETLQGLGSGVIVSEDGYILTNNHVVEGADEIMVRLGLQQKEYKAKKVGTDPGSDVAVLKIEAKNLPVITFADSDKARVGDVVLAVGSPYGLTETVTAGIISGMGRGGMGIVDYENFIQTDASINPGNSGGALVDTEGRMVGLNTAIFSQSGGNVGIGFAIPSNIARQALESIRQKGRVVRGYLGIYLQPLTQKLADAFKINELSGALVGEVNPKSPAEKAGIKNGDVIVEVNGKKVEDPRGLRLTVSGMAPGTKVQLKLVRDGKEKTVEAELGELPAKEARIGQAEPKEKTSNVLDGITVNDLDEQTHKSLNVPPGVQGAIVSEIDQESPGYVAGLRESDIIQEINHKPVKNANEAIELSEKVGKKDTALLRVWTRGQSRYVALEPK